MSPARFRKKRRNDAKIAVRFAQLFLRPSAQIPSRTGRQWREPHFSIPDAETTPGMIWMRGTSAEGSRLPRRWISAA